MPPIVPSRRAILAGLAGLSLAPATALAQRAGATPAPVGIEVAARRIETFSRTSSERRFGRLEFRGGLVLSSSHKDFGGFSGLIVEPDGRRFMAISDEGGWLTGEFAYERSAPVGIRSARMGRILGLGGRALARKRDQDAEGLALISGNLTQGEVLIAFERNHRVARHPITNGVLMPPIGLLRMPPEARRMRSNTGLEALAILQGGPHKGAVVAICENFPDTNGLHVGWIWTGADPRQFTFREANGFDVTDAAGLPDGSLLVLERRFRWSEGVKMQLRLLPQKAVAPGATGGTADMLLAADMSYEIDNMEGLAVHRGPRGETVLTMISDDNFNHMLQRTILLQFTLS